MDISEVFENVIKSKEKRVGIAICQDPKELAKITEFNYDIHDYAFVKYYESRTGDMITKMEKDYKEILHCNSDYREAPDSIRNKDIDEDHNVIAKQKLQACWEIWNEIQGR